MPKIKKTQAISAAQKKLRELTLTDASLKRLRKLGKRRVEVSAKTAQAMSLTTTPSGVVLAVPAVDTRELAGFQYPVLDDADLPLGGYVTMDVTALVWLTQQDNSRWDFMYRRAGEGVWRKPPVVAEDARRGMAALVLPAGVTYEFLPLARVR